MSEISSSKLTQAIIGIIMAVLVLGVVLVPIVSDATKTTETITNDGPRMSPLGEETLTITYANDNWNINGTDFGIGSFPIVHGTIMIFGRDVVSSCGWMYISQNDSYNRVTLSRTAEYTIVYDGANKTVDSTAIVNSQTYHESYTYLTEVYYADPNGAYAWFGEKPTNAYIPADWSRFNAWSDTTVHFYSIIGDTITVDGSIAGEGTTATLTTEDVPGYVGIKNVVSYTLNIEGQDPINCRGYILPYQINAELTNHLTPMMITLINIIPIFVVLAIILGVCGLFYYRRNENSLI